MSELQMWKDILEHLNEIVHYHPNLAYKLFDALPQKVYYDAPFEYKNISSFFSHGGELYIQYGYQNICYTLGEDAWEYGDSSYFEIDLCHWTLFMSNLILEIKETIKNIEEEESAEKFILGIHSISFPPHSNTIDLGDGLTMILQKYLSEELVAHYYVRMRYDNYDLARVEDRSLTNAYRQCLTESMEILDKSANKCFQLLQSLKAAERNEATS